MFFKKNKIVVYTAIFGGVAPLLNPVFDVKNCDFICFTDDPSNKNKYYKTVVREPEFEDPNRSAKRYKVLGDELIDQYDYSIWIDGRHQVVFKDAKDVIQNILINNGEDVTLMNHPDGRDCIYQEYEVLKSLNHEEKFGKQEIMDAQIKKYREEGFPEHFGLITGGFIVRNIKSEKTHRIMNAWWKEIQDHSRRDQLSFNYVLWKLKEKIVTIPGIYWDNEYIKDFYHKD